MLVTREGVVAFWASESKWEPIKDDVIYIGFGMIPFHDLRNLSPPEKEILCPVLAAHPEYLRAHIWRKKSCSEKVCGQAKESRRSYV